MFRYCGGGLFVSARGRMYRYSGGGLFDFVGGIVKGITGGVSSALGGLTSSIGNIGGTLIRGLGITQIGIPGIAGASFSPGAAQGGSQSIGAVQPIQVQTEAGKDLGKWIPIGLAAAAVVIVLILVMKR